MNSCNFIGNLGSDPEITYSQTIKDELAIARVSIAVENPFNHDSVPNWVRLVAFGKKAEVLSKHFKKGNKIGVNTHIQTGSYVDEDGYTVYTTDFIVDQITFCEKAEQSTPSEAPKKRGQAKTRKTK